MNISDFEQDILDPMEAHIVGFDRMRVWVAYRDVANLFNLMTWRLEHSINSQIWMDGSIGTLHKALIEFANVFMVILVHEAQQRPTCECTIGTLAKQPVAANINSAVLHQAYCLYIYRNKVIVHHEVPRGNAWLMEANGTQRLWPMPHQHSMDQKDVQYLLTLKAAYSALPDVAHQTNPYELLNALYYSIPGPHGGKPSSDRECINRIAERGGCRSMSPLEIIKTVDDFSREIARLAPL